SRWGIDEKGERNLPAMPWQAFIVNDERIVHGDQSIWVGHQGWAVRKGKLDAPRVVHGRDLTVGDILFSDRDEQILVKSVKPLEVDGWWRFEISGDHSYIVDGLTLHNASRFWVGGGASTNWNATSNTNWAATTGGANNQTAPGSTDTATFDANSGSGN